MSYLNPVCARVWQAPTLDGNTLGDTSDFCNDVQHDSSAVAQYGVGIWLSSATGGAATPASISVGTNTQGDGAILATTPLTGLLDANDYIFIPFSTKAVVIDSNSIVYIKVEIAATGASDYNIVAQLVGGILI